MEIKKEQYEQIKECVHKQRKPAKISNLDVMNAVVYVVGNGCLEKTGLNPLEEHGAAGIPNFIKAIVKILGTTIRNCTNSVTRLSVFSALCMFLRS